MGARSRLRFDYSSGRAQRASVRRREPRRRQFAGVNSAGSVLLARTFKAPVCWREPCGLRFVGAHLAGSGLLARTLQAPVCWRASRRLLFAGANLRVPPRRPYSTCSAVQLKKKARARHTVAVQYNTIQSSTVSSDHRKTPGLNQVQTACPPGIPVRTRFEPRAPSKIPVRTRLDPRSPPGSRFEPGSNRPPPHDPGSNQVRTACPPQIPVQTRLEPPTQRSRFEPGLNRVAQIPIRSGMSRWGALAG